MQKLCSLICKGAIFSPIVLARSTSNIHPSNNSNPAAASRARSGVVAAGEGGSSLGAAREEAGGPATRGVGSVAAMARRPGDEEWLRGGDAQGGPTGDEERAGLGTASGRGSGTASAAATRSGLGEATARSGSLAASWWSSAPPGEREIENCTWLLENFLSTAYIRVLVLVGGTNRD